MTTELTVERATIEMIPNVIKELGKEWDPTSTTYAAHVQLLVEYLALYCAHPYCPECNQPGTFVWGLAWGGGHCLHDGYPGRMFHEVRDTRDDPALVCEATINGKRHCTATRGEHTLGSNPFPDELRCPNNSPLGFLMTFRAPLVARFNGLLWSHPDNVRPRDADPVG